MAYLGRPASSARQHGRECIIILPVKDVIASYLLGEESKNLGRGFEIAQQKNQLVELATFCSFGFAAREKAHMVGNGAKLYLL